MIKANDLLKITMESIPQEVIKELEGIEKELMNNAKCGKRAYKHHVKNYQYRVMLLKTIAEYGYNVTLKEGTNTELDIWW